MPSRVVNRLREKWHLKSNWDVFAVIVVFSISGSSIVFAKRLFFGLAGITDATPFWIKFLFWLAIVFPSYQFFLIVYGTLLGQFKFFWAKEKAMARAISKLFRITKKKTSSARPTDPTIGGGAVQTQSEKSQ